MTSTKPSLRRRMVEHVLVPLVVTWAIGAAAVVGIAEHFAAEAFDRSLLDDAFELSSHVQWDNGSLSVSLSREVMNSLLFDQSESMYYAVLRRDGSLFTGRQELASAKLPTDAEHEFSDLTIDGRRVRAVSLVTGQPEPYVVVMGSTTGSRTVLLQRLLVYSALPQAVLLLMLVTWLRARIEDDLKPLGELEIAIEHRNALDLEPLPERVKSDVSTRDIERIAQAVDSLLSRLKRSVQTQREFAGTVAHELRTPLAGIRAQAAYAIAQQDPAVWREQLEGIAQAEQRASRLVDQLLALARAGEGQVALALEDVDLQSIARDVLLRAMPRARSAGVDLGGDGLEEPVTVRGDRALIEGILNNLIDNALRYGCGNAEPRITVAIARTEEGVELSVTDNGHGLPEGDVDQLTQRWVQGEEGRRAGDGAGLGLAIVSRYAQLLGARLHLGKVPSGGLRACLVFPAAS